MENKKYYYEFGIMPSEDIDDAYSLYFELDFELDTNNVYESCNVMLEKGLLDSSEAVDCGYIMPSSKTEYDWFKK